MLPQAPLRRFLRWTFPLLLGTVLTGCGTTISSIVTTIPSLPSEDVIASCTYELVLSRSLVQQGVLVLFERGDTEALYDDDTLRQAAQDLGFAIVWAHQCPSRSHNDLQADAAKGPGRMLFAALSSFAQITRRPELATNGVILYGFSAAGDLSITIARDFPQRLLGTIPYAAGSGYANLDTIAVSPDSAAIPSLILANADDNAAGTTRSFHYFQRGRAAGAPWSYAVQNATSHCCNLSTRNIIIPWINAIAKSQPPAAHAVQTSARGGVPSFFVCTPDGVVDSLGLTDCSFTTAGIESISAPGTSTEEGWLPDQPSADAWLKWVTAPRTN